MNEKIKGFKNILNSVNTKKDLIFLAAGLLLILIFLACVFWSLGFLVGKTGDVLGGDISNTNYLKFDIDKAQNLINRIR